MNIWGLVIIGVGLLLMVVGVRGTQGSVFGWTVPGTPGNTKTPIPPFPEGPRPTKPTGPKPGQLP